MKHTFKIGDKVTAINSKECKYQPREAGKEYTVHSVVNCPSCNEQLINISKKELPKAYRIKCSSCHSTNFSSNHSWTSASNFIPSTENLHLKLELAVKLEDYEEAAKIRDMINSQV
jgi:protein-arginine kinase activator protein McsA